MADEHKGRDSGRVRSEKPSRTKGKVPDEMKIRESGRAEGKVPDEMKIRESGRRKSSAPDRTENRAPGAEKNRRRQGAARERQAGKFLESLGYEILEYNFRSRGGEVDIVARDGVYLVFVEVKYRRDERAGNPMEAVDGRKQRRICLAASGYLARHHFTLDTPCRFDVVAMVGEETEVVKNAFPFCL